MLAAITVILMMGSTMAWFQDSEVVINTYTFGLLDVDICNEKGETIAGVTPIKFATPDNGTYADGEYLFEPGATFRLEDFYIKNKGTVDLKYRLELDRTSRIEGDTELLDAMDFYATIGKKEFELETDVGFLAAGEKSEPVKVIIHMKDSAGNEYQDLAVSGVVVKVLAVQGDGIPDDKMKDAFEDAFAKAKNSASGN